ncbi:MAG: hypothetical protein F4160_11920 [Rhodospirillaceae bacterium]|nr:hypothetical protein [Rhodospirillaceae bacterium]
MAERNTPRRTGMIDYVEAYKVKASIKIEAGHMVMLDATGLAVPATKADNHISVGMCVATVEAGASGDTFVEARAGVFRWNNDVAGKAFTRATVGNAAYVEDSETVRTDSNSSGEKVGRVVAVDDKGAWVATGIPFLW